jgi:GrpB-like predicted nucleotidyltransferase (UPF0157 family)
VASTELRRYDPRWPLLFARERDRVVASLPVVVVVEHFGSTAVPGLEAKPVVDMMASVPDVEGIDEAAVRDLGYREDIEHGMRGRRLFQRDQPRAESYHLHVVPVEGLRDRIEILFRDYLRLHPAAVADYTAAKRQAARDLTGVEYTRAKTASVQRIVDLARAELGLPSVCVWEE